MIEWTAFIKIRRLKRSVIEHYRSGAGDQTYIVFLNRNAAPELENCRS